MISEKQVLRKVDDNTLIEDKPVKEDGRTLEWRKGFEILDIQLSEVKIGTNFSVNDVDQFSHTLKKIGNKPEPEENIFKYIKPNPSTSRSVIGRCQDFDDNLYRLIKDSEESPLHKCAKLAEGIRVNIKECEEEPQSGESYPNGVYYGSLFWFEENDYGMEPFEPQIECRIPSSQMDKLIASIFQTPSPQVQMRVEVLSFRWEVDKALSEPWMSKDLLLEDSPPALLTSINVSSSIPDSLSKFEDAADKKTKNPLKRITLLLWLIAVLLLLQLFK